MSWRARSVGIAILGLTLLTAATVVVSRWAPTVPAGAASTVVATTRLAGPVSPDVEPTDGATFPPPSPVGQQCLDRIVRAEGALDLCWQAQREPNDADPTKDYYRLHVSGTAWGDAGSGIRWTTLRARMIEGTVVGNIFDAWPTGQFDGRCVQVPVNGAIAPPPEPAETLCGRTIATASPDDRSSAVTWLCVGCLLPDRSSHALAMYQLVGVEPGTIPAWELYADLGA